MIGSGSGALLMRAAIAIFLGTLLPNAASARDLEVVRPAMDCSRLSETDVNPLGEAPARIVSASIVQDGEQAPYCRVQGYVVPQVRFELRLPTMNWRQRLMFSGCGGFCGRVEFNISAAEDCAAIENGEFALVTSDLGHDTPDGNADTIWAAGNRQGKIDYGYRGVHVVTVAAKSIIERFYGRKQAYAYFNGCSDGGREGLMSVQRYPDDFDGVIAGAPVIDDTANNSIFHAWSARHLARADGRPVFLPEDLALLHNAALKSCDQRGDRLADGLVADPLSCAFDPAVLFCTGAGSACLDEEQVAAARAIYAGPRNSRGKNLYFGRPVGSELMWGGPEVSAYVSAFVRNMSEDKPRELDLSRFAFEPADLARYNSLAAIYNATDPDIGAFRKSGGKLILWHGLSDPGVPAGSTVAYYRDVRKRLGDSTDSFVKMYLLPGVGHCGGGSGPDKIDLVSAIVAWVEDGQAPEAILSVRKEYGRVLQSRPVYPFPAIATFRGTGDPKDAASFTSSDAP
jgi:feruloyl esterase